MSDRIHTTVSEDETIVGVLIPTGWDEAFVVTEVSLVCDGEREVVITNLDSQPDIHGLLRKRVQLIGKLIRVGKYESLDVSSYQVLDENEPNRLQQKGPSDEKNL